MKSIDAEVGMAAYRDLFEESVETEEDVSYWEKVGRGEYDLSKIINRNDTFEYDALVGLYGEDFDVKVLQKEFSELLKSNREEILKSERAKQAKKSKNKFEERLSKTQINQVDSFKNQS